MRSIALLLCVAVVSTVVASVPGAETAPATDATDTTARTDIFVSGTDGYHTFRIPSLIKTPQGVLLAFCEGRKTSRSDAGDIDLVLRRSNDGGKTWQPLEVVYEEGGDQKVTIGNPCPVVDREKGVMWLPLCRDNNEVLITSSADDGRTWTTPRNITATVKKPEWTWYATGPGVGIQLQRGPHRGRLMIPCDHRQVVDGKPIMFSHVFYSDDHGESWKLGGTLDRHTDECQVVELADGELSINMRNYWGRTGGQPERGGRRAIARSSDGGESWSPLDFDATLVEPVCQASLIAFPNPADPRESVLAFLNPATDKSRENLTLRLSRDGGKSWQLNKVIEPNSSAYSSIAWLGEGRLGLLFERDNYRRITYTMIDVTAALR